MVAHKQMFINGYLRFVFKTMISDLKTIGYTVRSARSDKQRQELLRKGYMERELFERNRLEKQRQYEDEARKREELAKMEDADHERRKKEVEQREATKLLYSKMGWEKALQGMQQKNRQTTQEIKEDARQFEVNLKQQRAASQMKFEEEQKARHIKFQQDRKALHSTVQEIDAMFNKNHRMLDELNHRLTVKNEAMAVQSREHLAYLIRLDQARDGDHNNYQAANRAISQNRAQELQKAQRNLYDLKYGTPSMGAYNPQTSALTKYK